MKYKVGDKVKLKEPFRFYYNDQPFFPIEDTHIITKVFDDFVYVDMNFGWSKTCAKIPFEDIAYVLPKKQTNREWLQSLSDEEFARWLTTSYEQLKYQYTDTEKGIALWLKGEHNDVG